ncbi:hypothetical protein GWI33_015368 [Rhynchophorus ferrugineus]|uniref:Uncharacterized protein n=1 Tax=Rhynchophorus ferrugineus TaxID=354439 RepID=A0A834M4K3_RHYFE|nr:hypothetical protein GWI33_015368 [Rhynchophorus ferrugineus]
MGFRFSVLCLGLTTLAVTLGADDDYNILQRDGSFQFGYNNPDSYHFANGNRKNVVRGEFGGRNPKTGAIDTTVYTAGPRGFRPRGKNIVRKYDLNQNGPRPVGSPDDPYFDPYEDPSYNFAFRTRTYSRQENANRVGDVTGKFTYLDDIGERHNVEYIAGKNTGFHVKTPFPDSNPRAYGPLFFRGKGKPIPRGRTSIQRGLDGSYKFVSAGPDQRRTEISDSTGHVRGSYTYLDDKGVQHSVHYIAGPETGYRVLKTVKGPHLPTVFPFDKPEIVPSDFYDYLPENGEVFDAAASGRPVKPSRKPTKPNTDIGNGIDKNDYDRPGDGLDLGDDTGISNTFGFSKPTNRPTSAPGGTSTKPSLGSNEISSGDDEASFDFGDLFDDFGGSSTTRPSSRPTGRPTGPSGGSSGRPTRPGGPTTYRPSQRPLLPGEEDDGSYRPVGDDGSYKPGNGVSSTSNGITTTRPGFGGYPSGKPTTSKPLPGILDYDDNYDLPGSGLFGSESGRPFGNKDGEDYGSGSSVAGKPGVIQLGGNRPCTKCAGTIVTNIGNKPFSVPPGVSVRQSPSAAYKSDTTLRTEQLNEASSEETEVTEKPDSKVTTTEDILKEISTTGTSTEGVTTPRSTKLDR